MEFYSILIQAISSCLLAAGLFYAGKQLTLLQEAHKQNHDWNRRNAAQMAIGKMHELAHISIKINKIFNDSNTLDEIPLEKILAAFSDDSALQQELHQLLNAYEGLARGIEQGIYDEEVIYQGRRGSMIQTFTNFLPYIRYRRKNIHETAYEVTQRVVNRWNAKQTNMPPRSTLGEIKL